MTNGTAPTDRRTKSLATFGCSAASAKAACAGSNVSSHSLKHWTSHQEELHSSSSPMSEPHKQWCCIASWQLGQFTRPPNATQYNSYTYYQTRKASPQITKPRKLLQIHIKPKKTTPNTYQTRKTAPIRKYSAGSLVYNAVYNVYIYIYMFQKKMQKNNLKSTSIVLFQLVSPEQW